MTTGAVVVLRAAGLGDLCTAVPALRAVARAWPDRPRLVCCPSALAPIVARADPGAVVVDHHGVDDPIRLPPETDVAVAVNLHGRGPQSHQRLLELAPRRLIAPEHPEVPWSGPTRWRDDEHEVLRWCRLLADHGVPADPRELSLAPSPTPAVGDHALVHPGAGAAARRWPVARWAEVVRRLRHRGIPTRVTGGPGEDRLVADLRRAAGLPPAADRSGTDLEGLLDEVARARLVLSADTGVAHLAFALARPSVTLYGPSAPAVWGPPDHPRHQVLWGPSDGDPDAARLDPGLARIGPGDVVDAGRRALAAAHGRRAPGYPSPDTARHAADQRRRTA